MSPLPARTRFCLLALLCSFSGGAVWAQDAAVPPGSRVRVWTETDARGHVTGTPMQGRLIALPSDSIVLDGPRGPLAIPRGSLSRMEVNRGRNPRGLAALKGAGIGALIGVAAGATLSLVLGGDECGTCETPAETALFASAILGSAGGLWGGRHWRVDPR